MFDKWQINHSGSLQIKVTLPPFRLHIAHLLKRLDSAMVRLRTMSPDPNPIVICMMQDNSFVCLLFYFPCENISLIKRRHINDGKESLSCYIRCDTGPRFFIISTLHVLLFSMSIKILKNDNYWHTINDAYIDFLLIWCRMSTDRIIRLHLECSVGAIRTHCIIVRIKHTNSGHRCWR